MKKVLYIGFNGKNNASGVLAAYLSQTPYLLTNSFEGVRRDIERIDNEYDYVLMFGVDSKLKDTVRIESVAERQGSRIVSELNIEIVSKELEKVGISNSISKEPAHYLCNEAYWFALQKFNGRAVFIHIPSLKNIDEKFFDKMKLALYDKVFC